jgi:hypothetical protein
MSKKCYWKPKLTELIGYIPECEKTNIIRVIQGNYCPLCGALITLDAPDTDADRKDEEARETALKDARCWKFYKNGYNTGSGYL